MGEYIGKHEAINVYEIEEACPGACFHGEVWVRCPYCGRGNEMAGAKPIRKKDGWRLYKCDCCERIFKDR